MANHDPSSRAEAAVPRWTTGRPSDLQKAKSGHVAHEPGVGSVWVPVRGPHLRTVRSKHARSRTGVTGVSMGTISERRKDGTKRVRTFYVVQLGKTTARYCIETLGRQEAWRRAITIRAEHEMKVRRANTAILAARTAVRSSATPGTGNTGSRSFAEV